MIFKILLVYMLSFIFTRFSLFFLGQRVQSSEIIFLLLFLLWLKDLIGEKRFPRDTGLNKPFLTFAAFCLLSFLNSSNLILSAMELSGLIYLFVMLILVVDIVDDRKKLDIIVKFWIGTLAAVLVLGFVGFFLGMISGKENLFCSYVYRGTFPYLKDITVYRVRSVFHNPLPLANYLVISLGIVASEFLLTENKRYKNFLKIMIFLMSLSILTLFSRELVGFLFVSFLIYNYFHKIRSLRFRIARFLLISSAVALFLFVTIFCSSFYIRSIKVEDLPKESNRELALAIDYAYDGKLAHKIAAVEMIKRHPFLGVGLKMYRSYLNKLNDEDYFRLKNFTPIVIYLKTGSQYFDHLKINDPHNDILQYLAETGVFGGISFIFFVAAFLYIIFSNLKGSTVHYFKVRLFCFAASFIGVLIESIDLDVFKIRPVWFLMALILALITIYKKDEKD